MPSIGLLLAVAALGLGLPCWTIGRWLLIGGSDVWRPEVFSAAGETLLLSLIAAVITTAVASPMSWLSVRSPGRLQRILEACLTTSARLGVVVGLALVTVTVRVALPLYQTVRPSSSRTSALSASRHCRVAAQPRPGPGRARTRRDGAGRTPLQAVWTITLRLAAPGAAASIALVTLGAATELTATLMLAPTGTRTLATAFWSLTGEIDYAAAAPYAASMVLASLPLTVLLYIQSRRIAGR